TATVYGIASSTRPRIRPVPSPSASAPRSLIVAGMDTDQDTPAAPQADPAPCAAAASLATPAQNHGAAVAEAAPPRSDSPRSPAPPGTILAAGAMIGLAIADLGFLVLARPGRFAPPD